MIEGLAGFVLALLVEQNVASRLPMMEIEMPKRISAPETSDFSLRRIVKAVSNKMLETAESCKRTKFLIGWRTITGPPKRGDNVMAAMKISSKKTT